MASEVSLAQQLHDALLQCRDLYRQLIEHGAVQRAWYEAHPTAAQTSANVTAAIERFNREKDAPVTVIVNVTGGVVQGASADGPVHLVVLDYDTEGAEPEEAFDIPQNDGGISEATVGVPYIDHDPTWILNVNNALLSQGVIL